ncbi:MAG: T9SS C-terminal target domain-containing protein, partial [Erysipelotrichaceae bacterium]|nr:T9SS C-terminal target domain-containing protein [Erysipelotrichaceae bacterium]
MPNLQYLDCTGNKLLTSLNVSGATNLTEMWASNNKLSSINIDGLTSLKKLYCQGNQFTTLAVNNLTTLEILSCGSNLLTSLNVSSLGNMKSLSCDYNKLQRLDVTNLSKLTTLNCSYNALWELKVNGLVNLKELNCQENVIPSLNIVGLNSLETLWCNVNGLSMLDVKGLNKLIDLRCNYNKLASLDLTGLTTISTLECFHNQLKTLDISDLVNVKSLRCDQNQLTSLFIRNGSNEGNNLNFSQNPDLLYICADESQLEQVKSLATNYGYSNCNVNSYCSFKPVGSYYTIKGINNFDGNNDGCDALDSSLPNLKFNLSDGTNTGSVIADINGNYSIYLAAGTHSITPVIENPAYFSISPTTLNVSFPTQTSPLTQDFCITPIGTHEDLEITLIPLEVARPGFNTKYKLIYKNKGNTTQSGAVSLTYSDSVLDLVMANPVVSTQAMNNLSWNFTNLKPFESKEITFT